LSRIAYYRVSTREQSIDAQSTALGGSFDREFADERISGASLAADRPGFAAMLDYVREGDTLYVAAVDRLGRDALDVQHNVRTLIGKGVTVDVRGIGPIARGGGELVVAVLAQIAQMERDRILERCDAGRATARVSLAVNGQTHRGKRGLGRQPAVDPKEVIVWREAHQASIAETARHFQVSVSTVKRACRSDVMFDADAGIDSS
jgi:putative DNA-invertase from lambdoid prophage Rac